MQGTILHIAHLCFYSRVSYSRVLSTVAFPSSYFFGIIFGIWPAECGQIV